MAWPAYAAPPTHCRPVGKGKAKPRRPKAGGLFGCSRGIFKKVGRADARRGVQGGVPPSAVERWARRWRTVVGQWSTRSVVHAVHGPQRCPRRNGPRATSSTMVANMARAVIQAVSEISHRIFFFTFFILFINYFKRNEFR